MRLRRRRAWASGHHRVAPLLDPNYCEAPEDREAALRGLRLAREILSQPALAPYVQREVLPGPAARTDEDLFKAIKHGGKAVNKSVLMPNWNANLSDDDIHSLVAYLRELCCKKN